MSIVTTPDERNNVKDLEGCVVKVFLPNNGASLYGTLKNVTTSQAIIEDTERGKSSVIFLNWVMSISKISD